ncbi:hypothetical protein ACRAKI_20005 [Saccharothrix isguenensis]
MSRYAYDDATLLSIINATRTAVDNMTTVNSRVLGIAGQLPSVNNSTSGMKLSMALSDWNSNFGRVVTNLNLLNEKANGLLQANRATDNEADSGANAAG